MTKIITPPTQEVITLADIKQYLRIDTNDDNGLLQLLIGNARQQLQELLRKAFLTQTLQSVLDLDMPPFGDLSGYVGRPTGRVEIPYPPLQSVTSIEFETEPGNYTLIDSSLYNVDTDSEPGRIWLTSNAFSTLSLMLWSLWNEPFLPRLRVTYVCGYTAPSLVPYQFRHLMYELVGHYYMNREGVEIPPGILEKIDAQKVYSL